MFTEILIANRGDKRQLAAQAHGCVSRRDAEAKRLDREAIGDRAAGA